MELTAQEQGTGQKLSASQEAQGAEVPGAWGGSQGFQQLKMVPGPHHPGEAKALATPTQWLCPLVCFAQSLVSMVIAY